MNTKGLIVTTVILLALFVVPTVPAVQGIAQQGIAQGLTTLPDDFKLLILNLVSAGVGWLLLKVNLGDFTQLLAAVLAPMIVTILERLTGGIPPIYDNLVLSILHIIVVSIGTIGLLIIARRIRQPQQLLQ